MTLINIDLLAYKRSKRILRIVESKHSNERMPKTQREILDILAFIFNLANKAQNKFTFEIYIVSGDYPYNQSEAIDLITDKKLKFNSKQELKDFMEFNSIPCQ